MSDQGGGETEIISHPFVVIGEWIAGFVPEGPLRTLVLVIEGLCAVLAPFIYKYYLGVLAQGAKPEGSTEREDYDRLRASLAGGNLAARLYAKWLTAFLDGVERFFGDAGMADRTLFPRAFGLKKPAPLWTAPALDRCLLLALIYPIVTIFLIWAISGDVGPAEAALGLKSDRSGWQRGLGVAAIGLMSFAKWRFPFNSWQAISSVTVGASVIFAVASVVTFAVAAGVTFAVAEAVTLGVGVGTHAVAFAFAIAVWVAVAFAGVGFGVVVISALTSAGAFGVTFAVRILSASAIYLGWQGRFLAVFLPAMTVACLVAALFLAPLETWKVAGPLLFFLVLLTLLNAPFDWASLGLTRALLRRGLELEAGGLICWRSLTRVSPVSSSRF